MTTTTTTVMEPPFSSTLSGLQSPAPGILQQRGEVEPAGDEEGSNSSVDQLCHVQTRHYKRRRRNEVARTRDAAAPPPLVQVEDPSTDASFMSILEINRTEGIEGEREVLGELPTKIADRLGVQCARSRVKDTRATLQKRRRSPGPKKPEHETDGSMKSNVMQPASAVKDGIVAVVEDHAAALAQVEEEAKVEVALSSVNVHVDRAVPRSLKALHAKFCEEKGDESGVQCARKDRRKDGTRKYWQCPMNAMMGHSLCDHHFLLVQANRARYAAAQQRRKAAAKRRCNSDFKNTNDNDVDLSGSHTQFDQVSAEVPELSLPLKPSIDTQSQAASDEKLDHTEAPDIADEISEDDHDHADADADQLLAHRLKNASKRWYVAPRKTADHAHVDAMKVNSRDRETSPGLILSPMIPPQPAINGGGRKAELYRSLLKSL